MNRRKLREHIFKIVFSYDFEDKRPTDEPLLNYFSGLEMEEGETEEIDVKEITAKTQAIIEHQEELDALISSHVVHWEGDRIAKVEMAILRVALYELIYDDSIPQNVAINEALELGKKYGGDQTASFLNGLLANILKAL